jgi:small subunit ribosomal protein S18
MRNYEFYCIVSPELTSEQTDAIIAKVQTLLEKDYDALNLKIEKEGLRKLAYPILKHNAGFYVSYTFEIEDESAVKINSLESKVNLIDELIRYMIMNQTDYLKQAVKQKIKTDSDIKTHRDLNKGTGPKNCISTYLGYRVIDFKNAGYLYQFTSPYSKIFARTKTGSSAKMHRKITRAIKQARHMALMSFTPKHHM